MRIAVAHATVSERICRLLIGVPGYDVVWIARDGVDAIRKCAADRPDLLLIDTDLPEMDGVEAIHQIMERTPCPILIVTQTIEQNAAKVFRSIGHGALDAVNVPLIGEDEQAQRSRAVFLKKVKMLFTLQRRDPVMPATDYLATKSSPVRPPTTTTSLPGTEMFRRGSEPIRQKSETIRPKTELFRMSGFQLPPLLVIGSSTGGPKTLVHVFAQLPKDFEAAIVVVQHLDQEFSAGLADWLNMQTPLRVRVAVRGTHPQKGFIDVAGTNDHLVLTSGLTFAYTPEPMDNPYRPSVDVFFRSVAKYWPDPGCAILLTGMGRDGAVELLTLRSLGWHTIAQDQATSVVYGMPKAAKELDAAVEILPLEQIAPSVLRFFAQSKEKGRK